MWAGQALKPLPPALSLPAADQVPLMEDLEQIFLRSWRESHLTEIRQYQQAPPQPFPPALGAVAPVTSAQLPWLAGLAASSCNDSVHVIECTYSLAEGLSEMFRLLIEGKLAKTNYVVIICACRSAAIDSCIAVTGEAGPSAEMFLLTPRSTAAPHPPSPPHTHTWLQLTLSHPWCALNSTLLENAIPSGMKGAAVLVSLRDWGQVWDLYRCRETPPHHHHPSATLPPTCDQ